MKSKKNVEQQEKVSSPAITDIVKAMQKDGDVVKTTRESPAPKKKTDAPMFKSMSSEELVDVLGLTIKKDDENKKIAFLVQLSAYTESSQLNLSFNAPSSTGKSYIPTEIARLFPEEDVMEIGYCSPTAFFHDHAQGYDKKTGELHLDLSRKIIIFLDQPHNLLLQHLRPILSHDKKIIKMKITDREQKGGLKTKNVLVKGFPAVIFCTATLKIDEQEATRFLMLSPQTSAEKIREAVLQKVKKEKDPSAYRKEIDSNAKRKLLKERIVAIKNEHIEDIMISSPEKIEQMFFATTNRLKPRHSRDIGKVISLIKAFALLNVWFRERHGATIIANDDDINEAFKIWDAISESQELGLPPYVYAIYQEVLVPLWREGAAPWKGKEVKSDISLEVRDITKKHREVYGRPLAEWLWQQMIAPMLEDAGLMYKEKNEKDKRKWRYFPGVPLTDSDGQPIKLGEESDLPPLNDGASNSGTVENINESALWEDEEAH